MFIGGGVGGIGRIGGGGRRGGGAAPPVFGLTPSTFGPLAATVHYHAPSQNSAITVDGNNRVTAVPDLRGLAAAVGVEPGGTMRGPVRMVDAEGRPFWRWRDNEALFISNALQIASARGYGVFFVGRMLKHRNAASFFSPRYRTYSSDASNVSAATAEVFPRALFGTAAGANGVPTLQNAYANDATNGWQMVPGSQLCVWGGLTRLNGQGGQRLYVNNVVSTQPQSTVTTTNLIGGVIGATPAAGNSISVLAANGGGYIDLYEFALFNRVLSDAEGDAIVAAMVANWGIQTITRQAGLDGDSIFDGIPTALPTNPQPGGNIGALLAQPGRVGFPPNVRVINLGSSGAQIANLNTRKNSTQSLWRRTLAGGPANNIAVIQIGRNDMVMGGLTGAQHYANVVNYFNNATTGQEGLLQLGWRVFLVSNIATTSPTGQARIEAFRALIMDPVTLLPTAQFLADCNAGPGQPFEGRLHILPWSEIRQGGVTRFKTAADASDWGAGEKAFDEDGTHLVTEGNELCVTGGDNPAHGLLSVLAA